MGSPGSEETLLESSHFTAIRKAARSGRRLSDRVVGWGLRRAEVSVAVPTKSDSRTGIVSAGCRHEGSRAGEGAPASEGRPWDRSGTRRLERGSEVIRVREEAPPVRSVEQ